MGIDRREIGHPIAVIAGALLPLRPLHHLVLEHRRQPDRGRAERLDIVEPPGHAFQVAAVEKTLGGRVIARSEEHTSELQSLMRISYAVFCLKKKKKKKHT